MIRRISKRNDYRDIVRSCPSGVIDDIYAIEYYIQGHNEVIQADFTKKGRLLEVILPSSNLENLPNGILMRRSKYKNADSSFPDQYYDLEFEDNLNVWLGDVESEEPVIPEYVTEEELSSTLSSYATQDWVSSQQFLTSENLPSDLATKSWVQSQGYLTASTIPSDIATEEWVRSYTYDRSTVDYVCEKATSNAIDWVQEQGYLTASTIPSDIATESWVLSQGYVTVGDLPSGLATQSWVESYTYDKSTIAALVGKAQGDAFDEAQEWVSSQQFATQSWVQSQGYLTSVPSEYATQSWVHSQGYITIGEIPSGLATQSWVSSNFLSATALTGYATESWVSDNAIIYDSSLGATIGYPHMVNLGGDDIYIVREDGEISGCYQGVYITDLEAGLYTHTPEDETYEPFVTEQYLFDNEYVTQYMLSNSSVITSAGLATQSWVQQRGYITSSALSGYATQSWATDQFLEENKVWCGTAAQWNNLTAEEKASYKIALVTA